MCVKIVTVSVKDAAGANFPASHKLDCDDDINETMSESTVSVRISTVLHLMFNFCDNMLNLLARLAV